MKDRNDDMTAGDAPLLTMRHIMKAFGGNKAVNDVSIDVHPGKILALLGENGAGKSTLIKILAGVYSRDSGEILFKGNDIVSARSIRTGTEQPIAFIHQDLGLIEWMTVAENMAFSMGFPRRFGLIDWQGIHARAESALEQVGIALDPDARVFELSRTEKSLLAIARAVAVEAEILVLDEPTASLPADDVKHLFDVLNALRRKKVGMIYVTHRLDEVIEIADQVAIMRDGRYVSGGDTSGYTVRDLVHQIVGEEKSGDKRRALSVDQDILLELSDVVVGETGPISFTLRHGEMLALAGLRGAGQEEIGRCLFGLRRLDRGSITLGGQGIAPHSPRDALRSGISLVAGDRTGESLVMSFTVQENLFVNPCVTGCASMSLYTGKQEARKSWPLVERFDVRPREIDIDVSALSGGNQQKVVMARWLNVGSPLLILEDPTAGVDVGARAEIYDLLNEALERGTTVLLISNDFEEIARVCNRAIVLNRGQVAGELFNQDVSFANLLELASSTQKISAAGEGHGIIDIR